MPDEWHDSHSGAVPDGSPRQPSQASEKTFRVRRGGSWNATARNCRAADRYYWRADLRIDNIGFRPVRGQAQGVQVRQQGGGGATEAFDAVRGKARHDTTAQSRKTKPCRIPHRS